VITRFFANAGRHRRVILVVALFLTAGYLLVHAWVPNLGERAFPALVAASMIFLLLGVLAAVRGRSKAFVAESSVPAFSTSPQPTLTFLALGYFPIGIAMAGNVVRDWGSEPFLPDQLMELGYSVIVVLWTVAAWRDRSVQLRPDGLWQRGITGWLVIPWEAAPAVPALPPPPTARTVRLTYGRPELVRRHGLHVMGHRLRTDDIDPRLLCAAIRYYLGHPEQRPAIGTRQEYERVMPQLLESRDWSPRHTVTAEPHS
jgi:hypothetical protein